MAITENDNRILKNTNVFILTNRVTQSNFEREVINSILSHKFKQTLLMKI